MTRERSLLIRSDQGFAVTILASTPRPRPDTTSAQAPVKPGKSVTPYQVPGDVGEHGVPVAPQPLRSRQVAVDDAVGRRPRDRNPVQKTALPALAATQSRKTSSAGARESFIGG